jgi:hypothetical protein
MDLRSIAHAEVVIESLVVFFALLLDLSRHSCHFLLLLHKPLLYLDTLVDLGWVGLVLIGVVRVCSMLRDAAMYFELSNMLVDRQLTAIVLAFTFCQMHSQLVFLVLLTVSVSRIHPRRSILQWHLLVSRHSLEVFLI